MASSKNPAANVDMFDLYFQRADLDRDGRISGAEAVAFFQGAGLPNPVLAQVWAFADQRRTGFLGRDEFYNALKLVTVAQSNRKLTPDTVKAALHSPVAAKIPAPKINVTAAPQTQIPGGQFKPAQPVVRQDKISAPSPTPIPGVGPVTGQNQAPWPKMTQNDAQKYMRIFVEVDTDKDGKITGDQARNLFLSWRLPREVLKQVWDLSDQDNDSMLSYMEFCVALYLLERHREGRPIPAALPSNVMLDISGFVQPFTYAGSNAAWRQSVISGPGGQQTMITMGSRPPLPRPVAVPQGDEDLKVSQPKLRVPELEKHQLSTEEQNSLNLKFKDAMKAEKKVKELEQDILESRQKIEYFGTKMQELSRCDQRLNEIMERSSADRKEVESLAKKYEEKYKQIGDVASKLTIEEPTFRDIQWIGMDGRTPLTVACTRHDVLDVAKTPIELGANLNAYCPGLLGGTPLHHAAREGLEETVMLLLSHGANALVKNDDCQTPLDVARINEHSSVVRLIENHICYFSGWVRQIYGPGFVGAVVPHLLTKKIWVVVIPLGPNNAAKPLKLELAVYTTSQDSQPTMVIHLWNAQIEQPNLSQLDPSIAIFDDSTQTRLKLASGAQGDIRQLLSLYNACRGISQIGLLPAHGNTQTSVPSNDSNPVDTPPAPNSHQTPESVNTNVWEVSSNNESYNGWGSTVATAHPKPTTGQLAVNPVNEDHNGWNVPYYRTPKNPNKNSQMQHYEISSVSPTNNLSVSEAPSAPPITVELLAEGPICYPSIDLGPDIATPLIDNTPSTSNAVDGGLCAICWEAPTQGACVPCGHMAGCITCLTTIKDKGGGCPVCRSKIDQVVRLYTV